MSDVEDQIENQSRYRQALKYTDKLDEIIQEALVKDLVRLALFTESKRTFISKDEMMKALKTHRQAYPVIFQKAQKVLQNVFGMELVQLVTHSKSKDSVLKKSNHFVLRCVAGSQVSWSETETENMNFLTLILALIYGHGKSMPHETLKVFMSKLELDLDGNNDYYGSVPEVMTLFIKQGYLDKYKEEGKEDFVYCWGPRSKALYTEDSITEYIQSFYADYNEERKRVLGVAIQRSADGI